MNSAKIFHIFSWVLSARSHTEEYSHKEMIPLSRLNGKNPVCSICTQVSLNNCRQISKWIYSFKNLFKILKRANLIAVQQCGTQDRLIIFQNIVKLSDIGHSSILVHDFVPIIFVKQSVFKKKMRIFLINKKFSMLNDQ